MKKIESLQGLLARFSKQVSQSYANAKFCSAQGSRTFGTLLLTRFSKQVSQSYANAKFCSAQGSRTFGAFILLAVVLIFAGCGYKSASYYANKSLGDKIFVNVATSPSQPENTVKVRDQVRMALMTKFGARLTDDQNSSKTQLNVSIASMDASILQTNAQGFAIVYRMNVVLNSTVKFNDKNKTLNLKSSGSQNFPVDPAIGISSSAQTTAIASAAGKAVDELISQLALSGITK